MSFLRQLTNRYIIPGPGMPPPYKGYKRFVFLLYTHFTKLVLLNFVFILFCLPVITAPAALAGMNRVLMKLVREGNCFLWHDFWKEFKDSFIKTLIIFIFFGLIIGIIGISSYIYINYFSGIFVTIAIIINLFIFYTCFSSLCYCFALVPMVNLSIKQTIKNSFLLVIADIKRTLLLLIPSILIIFYLFFLPLTIPIIFFIGFSFLQLIICSIVNTSIQQYIIMPFQNNSSNLEFV